MKKTIIALLLLVAWCYVDAQVSISGKVFAGENQEPVIFANMIETGTTNFTQTDIDGLFEMTVAEAAIIEISYLGYQTYQLKVNPEQKYYEVNLLEDAVQLEKVVVTAFGIEKDKKAAGFSFSEVDGDDLNQARELNVASQLAGKVAGLEITKPSNGAGGATRIVIRGLAQFSGDNSPLIIIDGITIANDVVGSAGLFGGRDSGDGLTALNPDDIENITILKGLSATALYGSRGANGAVIITTKKGTKGKCIGVEYTSNFVTEQVALLPNYQEQYGQGANGLKPTSQQEAIDNWRSWGAKLDGSETPIFNGSTLPYSAVGQEDIRSFYENGQTFTNGLAFNASNKKISTRTSVTHTSNRGIVKNSKYKKYGVNLNASYKPIDKLSLNGKINLVQEEAENRTNLTDNPSNPAKYFVIAPANLPQDVFSNTRDADGDPIYWSNNPFTLSPYWGVNENNNHDTKKRITAMGSVKYEIFDWLSTQLRVTTDRSDHNFFNVEVDGTQHNMAGSIFLDTFRITENNYDFLVSADKPLNDNIGLKVNLGATRTDRFFEQNGTVGTGYIESQVSTLENMNVIRQGALDENKQRINAMFANATVSINNYLYLEGSIRNDFLSVLTNPDLSIDSDNSVVYGAGSLSFILSDAIKTQKWLSFAKLRLGYGVSGFTQNAPYSQVATYFISTDPKEVDGNLIPIANINGDEAVNPLLQPSRTTALELGADLRFFNNRLGLDVTYYNQITDNHIIPNPLPASAGFNSITLNAGKVKNNGIEFLINSTPIKTNSFTWTASLNFAKNVNTVLEINEGIEQLNFGADRTFSANIIARRNGQIGEIWGNVYDRNDQGQIIHDNDGLPQIAAERQILGNFNPDWYGGLTNTFRFKEWNLAFLIDTKQGGEILSTTSSFGYLFGRHIKTLPGRDSEDFTILGQGVAADGETINTTPAKLDTYYERISSISEENVYDASYIKLRQLTLGYNFSKKVLDKMKFIKGINLSLVARNLYFFQNGLDELGLDPESIYTATGNDIGIEYAALPSTRTFGFNLKVKF